ncbi:hypothetical protein Dimus_039679 [Dionaea muscipula]
MTRFFGSEILPRTTKCLPCQERGAGLLLRSLLMGDKDLSSILLVREDGLVMSSGGRLRGSGDSSLVLWSSCLLSTLQSSVLCLHSL